MIPVFKHPVRRKVYHVFRCKLLLQRCLRLGTLIQCHVFLAHLDTPTRHLADPPLVRRESEGSAETLDRRSPPQMAGRPSVSRVDGVRRPAPNTGVAEGFDLTAASSPRCSKVLLTLRVRNISRSEMSTILVRRITPSGNTFSTTRLRKSTAPWASQPRLPLERGPG